MTHGRYELRSNGEDSKIFGPTYEDENELAIAAGMMPRRSAYWRLIAECEASSWLAAKVAFGETLTPLQDRMVKGTASTYEVLGHTREESCALKNIPKRRPGAPDLSEEIVDRWLDGKGEEAMK
jgi:hypothetical protein